MQYQNQPITTNRTSICFSLTKILDEQLIINGGVSFAGLFAAGNYRLKYARPLHSSAVGTENRRNFNLRRAKIKQCAIL